MEGTICTLRGYFLLRRLITPDLSDEIHVHVIACRSRLCLTSKVAPPIDSFANNCTLWRIPYVESSSTAGRTDSARVGPQFVSHFASFLYAFCAARQDAARRDAARLDRRVARFDTDAFVRLEPVRNICESLARTVDLRGTACPVCGKEMRSKSPRRIDPSR